MVHNLVSILIPAYNAEKTIRRCLDSVLRQTWPEIEVIIVNDGSADATESIISMYANHDCRVTVVNQSNSGVASARNACLLRAKGEFVLYVDADDWIEQDMIERMMEFGQCPEIDIVLCNSDNADCPCESKRRPGHKTDKWDHNRQLMEFLMHKQMTGMLWNKMIRRNATDGCSFNEATGYGEDAEFLWTVLKKSKWMVVTDEVLYHHTLQDTSISHLSFSDKKYSAIPMWERIYTEVDEEYPQFKALVQERLMCAAVFSLYEIRYSQYHNDENIKHLRHLVRKGAVAFLLSKNISIKYKLYSIAACFGL